MRRLFFALLVIAFGSVRISPAASAQPPSTCYLRGQEVRASDHTPIAGMAVSTMVFAGASNNTVNTVTAQDGRWMLLVPQQSAYYLSFSHPNYQPMTRRVVLDLDCEVFGGLVVFDSAEEALERFLSTEFPFDVQSVTLHAERYGIRTYLVDCGDACGVPFRVFVGQADAYPGSSGWWNVIAWMADVKATAARPPADWLGSASGWWRHGFGLSITADGRAVATWRTYRWCSDNPTPPCDGTSGNQILPGGRATIALSTGSGASSFGRVIESTDPEFLPLGPVALTQAIEGTLWLSWDDYGILLCGEPPAYLAAELIGQPCGA